VVTVSESQQSGFEATDFRQFYIRQYQYKQELVPVYQIVDATFLSCLMQWSYHENLCWFTGARRPHITAHGPDAAVD
jgi:hypothetical protein